jgi:hypothetical protein
MVIAYTFQEGVICIDVDENRQGGSQVYFWVPVAVVSEGDPPRRSPQLAASCETGTAAFTCVAATIQGTREISQCRIVDVSDNTDHVCAAIVNGNLRVDANENQETAVHIAVPVETIRDVINRLEQVSPGI